MTDDGTDLHLLTNVLVPGCYLLVLPTLILLVLIVHALGDSKLEYANQQNLTIIICGALMCVLVSKERCLYLLYC